MMKNRTVVMSVVEFDNFRRVADKYKVDYDVSYKAQEVHVTTNDAFLSGIGY